VQANTDCHTNPPAKIAHLCYDGVVYISHKEHAMSQTTKETKKSKSNDGFSAEERAAMKERAKELKASASKEEDEKAVLAKIDEMTEPERTLAMQLHTLIKTHAPTLSPKTWYGMPAYNKDGKTLCFFQSASKFGSRYATLGFSDVAMLDDGDFWAASFAIRALTPEIEAKIIALLKKAVG
jgi:uncharacterized protein YdhG (YjbR/CyaY superfamily)